MKVEGGWEVAIWRTCAGDVGTCGAVRHLRFPTSLRSTRYKCTSGMPSSKGGSNRTSISPHFDAAATTSRGGPGAFPMPMRSLLIALTWGTILIVSRGKEVELASEGGRDHLRRRGCQWQCDVGVGSRTRIVKEGVLVTRQLLAVQCGSDPEIALQNVPIVTDHRKEILSLRTG